MAATPPIETGTQYDVFISRSEQDVDWAARLSSDLAARGLRIEVEDHPLASARALVVLWSQAAASSEFLRGEIADAVTLGLPLFPIVLGDDDLVKAMPRELASSKWFLLGGDAYAAGSTAPSEAWEAAVQTIVAAVAPRPPPPPEPAPAKAKFERAPGGGAYAPETLRALAAAEQLIATDDVDDAEACSAALIGALRTAALGDLPPTTGTVLRFVLDRRPGRDARQTLEAAAGAAGLAALPWAEHPRESRADLGSVGRRLADDVHDLASQVGAERVRLHHVLALGLRPELPDAVTDTLGASLGELREAWRVALAATWPEESWDRWTDVLGPLPRRGPREPTARVHGDRWTTDDRLDYTLYAKAISAFIRHRDAKPPMVISIQAPWGQGKTSLMRMVQAELDPTHPDLEPPAETDPAVLAAPASTVTFKQLSDSLDGEVEVEDPKAEEVRSVWFNAWKYQNSEQIWAGLAHAILEQLPARLGRADRERFWLRMQVKRIDPGAVRKDIHRLAFEKALPAVVVVLAALLAGVLLVAAGEPAVGGGLTGTAVVGTGVTWWWAHRRALEKRLEGSYLRYVRQPDYEGKLGYLHLTEEDMRRALSLLAPKDQPVVIFIDDLDRCSPTKVGEVIEAVNLFLSGEYPNCAFVMGMDAEVVAASMEVVHADIIEQLGARRGELGWRFMDKFVQLPFVLPRLNPKQRDVYLDDLFSVQREAEDPDLEAEAAALEDAAAHGRLPIDELTSRAGAVTQQLAASNPDRARELGAAVIAAGADQFSDGDAEVLRVLREQLPFLSDNPRTIKRAVNLYRFHRFVAFARQVSPLPLEVARPEQIARWIVVIVRWPQFVHWVQAEIEETGRDPLARIDALAGECASAGELQQALQAEPITAAWTEDRELLEFLRADVRAELKLQQAGARGLW